MFRIASRPNGSIIIGRKEIAESSAVAGRSKRIGGAVRRERSVHLNSLVRASERGWLLPALLDRPARSIKRRNPLSPATVTNFRRAGDQTHGDILRSPRSLLRDDDSPAENPRLSDSRRGSTARSSERATERPTERQTDVAEFLSTVKKRPGLCCYDEEEGRARCRQGDARTEGEREWDRMKATETG